MSRARWTRACLIAMTALSARAVSMPAQDLAILGGQVHPVSGPPIPGGTVLIRDGVIVAVGSDVDVPAGVPRLDAMGKVVTPGLFDASTSIGLVEVGMVRSTRDDAMEGDPIRAAFDVADGINPRSTLIPVNRLGGVTTVLSRPTGGILAGRAAVIDLDGASVEDMLVRRDAAMMAAFGAGAAAVAGGSRGSASLRLREVLDDARFWKEHRDDYARGLTRPLAASRLDLEALQPVLEGRVPLVVAVSRGSDIETVLRIGAEYGLTLVLEGAEEAWMVADEIVRAGVPVIVKPLSNSPGFDRLGARFDNAALLNRAGVDVSIGSFDSHNARWITLEAGNAVRVGLPWEVALRAVTLAPARAFGAGDTHGSLEPGKVGNVVVWSGDPFEVSTRAEAVVIRGRIVPPRSRQTELLQRYRTLGDLPPAYRGGGDEARTP